MFLVMQLNICKACFQELFKVAGQRYLPGREEATYDVMLHK